MISWRRNGSYCSGGEVVVRRIQWIELHEQPWFPSSLRDEVTDARCQQIVVRCPWTPQIPAFSRSSPVDWTVWVEDTNSPMKVLKSSPWASQLNTLNQHWFTRRLSFQFFPENGCMCRTRKSHTRLRCLFSPLVDPMFHLRERSVTDLSAWPIQKRRMSSGTDCSRR